MVGQDGIGQKLAERGETNQAASVVSEGVGAPSNEDELHEALTLAGGMTDGGNWGEILKAFVAENPASAFAHHSYSVALIVVENLEQAQKHYQVAVALDSEYQDAEMDAIFTEGDEESVPEVAAIAIVDDEIQPEPVEPEEESTIEDEIQPVPVEPDEEVVQPVLSAVPLSPPGAVNFEERSEEDLMTLTQSIKFDYDPDLHPAAHVAVPEVMESQRSLVVADGEIIPAAEKQSDTSSKASALTVALIVHAVIFLLLALVNAAMPQKNPPLVVTSALANLDDMEDMEEVQVQRMQARPEAAMAGAQVNIVSVTAASSMSLPSFDVPEMQMDMIGATDSFGLSMNLGMGEDGGMVSFFGSRTTSKKVVFVVDASASMKATGLTGKTKFELMKAELTKTISALPSGVEFQILFFSGPSWFLGDDPKKAKADWAMNPPGKNFWEYKGGDPEKWKPEKYIKASPSKIRKATKEIEETIMMHGTDWRDPLKMAMMMEPDTIYFMTDGAVSKHPDKSDTVDDVLEFSKTKSNAVINTVCLMILRASDDLQKLAKETKGKFTLVLEDGTVVRGRDIDKLKKK